MEITIWKTKEDYNATIYETYKASKEKKASITIVSTSRLEFAISLAWKILRNYKWLDTSSLLEVSKPKKYYNNKNKKSNKKA